MVGRSVVVLGIDVTSLVVGEVVICISMYRGHVVSAYSNSTRLPPTQSCEAVAS